MQLLRFILLCFIWLATMVVMVIMAPVGKPTIRNFTLPIHRSCCCFSDFLPGLIRNPNPFFFKAVMIGFDFGVMNVLMLMIKQRGVSPSRLLLYAANPLILLYVSGKGGSSSLAPYMPIV